MTTPASGARPTLAARKNMLSTSSPRLLTLNETAALLSVSVPAVRRLIAAGQLPHIRFNRRLLVDTKDLDRFIDRSRQAAF